MLRKIHRHEKKIELSSIINNAILTVAVFRRQKISYKNEKATISQETGSRFYAQLERHLAHINMKTRLK